LNTNPRNIIISRTDSIGDVVLTLPLAKLLKERFPKATIAFMGKDYTRPVISVCQYVDLFIDVTDFLRQEIHINGEKPDVIIHVFPTAEIAKRAKQLHIPLRIGTTNRLYHWLTCNKLVKLSRKNSPLHEAQLNIRLLDPFSLKLDYTPEQIGTFFGLSRIGALPEQFKRLISPTKYNLILHPKSQGSAREWGLPNFIKLVYLLDKTRFNIFISGTAGERALLDPLFAAVGDDVTDITGLMNLNEFISFINECDGLVANSTGPLHIAAALGKDALGIYPPIRPMHPGRWAPLGTKAKAFVLDKNCEDCRKNSSGCNCIAQVSPSAVALWLAKSETTSASS
jgi:ADP-heptose:LPS heptosyltransferase